MNIDLESLLPVTATKSKDAVYVYVSGTEPGRHTSESLRRVFDAHYVFPMMRESSVFRVFMERGDSLMMHLLLDPYALRASLAIPWSLTSVLVGRWQISSRRAFPLATGLLLRSRLSRFLYLVWLDLFCGGVDRFRRLALLEAIHTAQSNPWVKHIQIVTDKGEVLFSETDWNCWEDTGLQILMADLERKSVREMSNRGLTLAAMVSVLVGFVVLVGFIGLF